MGRIGSYVNRELQETFTLMTLLTINTGGLITIFTAAEFAIFLLLIVSVEMGNENHDRFE